MLGVGSEKDFFFWCNWSNKTEHANFINNEPGSPFHCINLHNWWDSIHWFVFDQTQIPYIATKETESLKMVPGKNTEWEMTI